MEMAMEKEKHALVMPFPGQGHINPMLHLSRKLARAGVTVTFVNIRYIHSQILRTMARQLKKHPAATVPDLDNPLLQLLDMVELDEGSAENGGIRGGGGTAAAPIRLMSAPDGISDSAYTTGDVRAVLEGFIEMSGRLMDLAQSLRPKITCLISDILINVCTPVVARRLAIPHVGVWLMSATGYSAHVLFTRNPAHFKELMSTKNGVDENRRPAVLGIPGCPPLKPEEVVTPLNSCDPAEFFFDCCIQNFGVNAMEHSHILINTFEALEPEAMEFLRQQRPNMLAVGPMLPAEYLKAGKCEDRRASMWEEDEGCMEWLDAQPEASVLYLSFGSMARLSAEQGDELAGGLVGAGCKVLGVVRMGEEEAGVFPDSFAMSEKVRFVEWAPQLAVLAHPSVGGFLTHAGWNSTTEAISAGVPMLCWPFFGDQMMNCRGIIDYWRIGLELHKDKSSNLIERGEIESKVKFLMDPASSGEMRERARCLSVRAKECFISSSTPNLESFLQSVSA